MCGLPSPLRRGRRRVGSCCGSRSTIGIFRSAIRRYSSKPGLRLATPGPRGDGRRGRNASGRTGRLVVQRRARCDRDRRPRLRTDREVPRRPAVRARGAGDRRPRQHRSLAPARNRDPWSRQRDPDAASADSHPSRADRLLGIDARGRLSPRSRIAHRSKKKPPGASTPAARQPGRTDRHPGGRSVTGHSKRGSGRYGRQGFGQVALQGGGQVGDEDLGRQRCDGFQMQDVSAQGQTK